MSRQRKGDRRPAPSPPSTQREADVIEMYGLEAILRAEPGGERLRALLRKAIARQHGGVVVGDRVRYAPLERDRDNPDGPEGVIEAILPRRNVFLRTDMHNHPRPVAANLDYVVIVVTPDHPPLRLGLIDRYLAACLQSGIDPVICLNKRDLDADGAAAAALEVYRKLQIPVLETSALEERGLEPLRALLTGARAVLVGHSGVGKSSLSCALIPGLERRIGDINEAIGRGRHTTTTACLLPMPAGGELVDTPGVRAFGLAGVEPKALASLYPEFLARAEGCRFRGCTHLHEPHCRVRAALADGEIDPGRYERYQQLYATLEEERAHV
jgi:ribosome biogenesis GTPase